MNSNMAQKYIHYFGNESSESLLEAYGIVTKNNVPIDTLNPKICPNWAARETPRTRNSWSKWQDYNDDLEGYQSSFRISEGKRRRTTRY